MAVRTNADDVRLIMDNCTVDDEVIDAIIVAANAVVDQVFSGDTTTGASLLEQIEKWFTAHLIASGPQRQAAQEEIQDARIKYTGTWGKKLESTSYGQAVLAMDVSGKMAKLGKGTVKMRAIISFDE